MRFVAYGAVRGDLGTSLKSKLPVVGEIAERMPFTLGLAITAYLLAIGDRRAGAA